MLTRDVVDKAYLPRSLIEDNGVFVNGQEVRAGNRRKKSMNLVLPCCTNVKSILSGPKM